MALTHIAIDIDDTLYSFSDLAKDALFRLAQEYDDKSIFNAAYTPSTQWRTPHDVAGDVWIKAIELSHRPEVIMAQEPYHGAVETLNALVENDFALNYISNRDAQAAEATEQWLAHHGFPLGEDIGEVTCLWGDKVPELAEFQYIIDDRPSTLIRFVFDFDFHDRYPAFPRKGFGLQTPYNENLTDVPNIYLAPSWAGLNHYLVSKGLLDKPAYEALGSVDD